jgi:hypothetical protein
MSDTILENNSRLPALVMRLITNGICRFPRRFGHTNNSCQLDNADDKVIVLDAAVFYTKVTWL